MAQYLNDISRTFSEYLLIPGLTTKEHTPANISLIAENAVQSGLSRTATIQRQVELS